MKRADRSIAAHGGAFVALLVALVAPAQAARETLGVFAGWAAFREGGGAPRCFAVAEPVRRGGDRWRATLAIGFGGAFGHDGQLHIRLAHRKARGAPVVLAVGDSRFALIAGGSDAWAPDARIDAAIVSAIRAGTSLTVETRAASGRAFADAYALRGAASAIDAAALGCLRAR